MGKNYLNSKIIEERKRIEKQKKDLICDFDKGSVLEVKLSNGEKARVTYLGFRSWGGERYVDGILYQGLVYLYGTNQINNGFNQVT